MLSSATPAGRAESYLVLGFDCVSVIRSEGEGEKFSNCNDNIFGAHLVIGVCRVVTLVNEPVDISVKLANKTRRLSLRLEYTLG